MRTLRNGAVWATVLVALFAMIASTTAIDLGNVRWAPWGSNPQPAD